MPVAQIRGGFINIGGLFAKVGVSDEIMLSAGCANKRMIYKYCGLFAKVGVFGGNCGARLFFTKKQSI